MSSKQPMVILVLMYKIIKVNMQSKVDIRPDLLTNSLKRSTLYRARENFTEKHIGDTLGKLFLNSFKKNI